MKLFYAIVIVICLVGQTLSAKDFTQAEIQKNLPKMLGANNIGTEFYFSFIPCWETSGASNDLKIYISSTVETKVRVEVKGKGYEKIKYTIPNDIIEFTLAPAIGQPYRKTDRDLPEPDQVWLDAGIHVTADDPIICYGVTRYQYSSDGFLAIPVNSLGKEYIPASYADPANNSFQWFSSYVSITAAYEETKVRFTMGGTDWSTTGSGQRPGEVSNWNLNAGDVLLFGSLGEHAELTGSKVEATKPVAVVSGSFCAYIPTNCGCCDVIESMELPTNSWGTEYHVASITERKKNSMIKIFAKEPKTNIFRDSSQIGFIRNAGDVEGVGYIAMRARDGEPRPIVIRGDKPISVTQFNCGQQDDNVPSDPFQMVLTPIEQYQTEIIFNTPGIRGGFGFPKNYINLIYESADSGRIPYDLEFAQVVTGDFQWQKVMDMSPDPGVEFYPVQGDKIYYSKTMLLPGDGVYRIRAERPFAAYSYGFSSYDSYGFPTSVAIKDLTIVDTLPPKPEWEMDCEGNVNTGGVDKHYVKDMPEDENGRINLYSIYMHSDVSKNYKLYHGDFMPCEDQTAAWALETIDPMEDAFAAVTFADCAGNDTTVFIEYSAPDLKLVHREWDYGTVRIGESRSEMFHIVNYGASTHLINEISLKNADLKNDPQGFTLFDEDKTNQLTFPVTINAGDSLHFWVRFDATEPGTYWDSIGFGDDCNFFYKSYVRAFAGYSLLEVADWDFHQVCIGEKGYGEIVLANKGTTSLSIYGYSGLDLKGDSSNKDIFYSLGLSMLNISKSNPFRIEPGRSRNFTVQFEPDESLSFIDTIFFLSNSYKTTIEGNIPDTISVLTGEGINCTDIEDKYSYINIYPNPIKDKIVVENLPENATKIQMIDESGKKVKTIDITRSKTRTITMSDLASGTYILQIQIGNEVLVRKLIKY